MNILERHFWLLCGLWGGGLGYFRYSRMIPSNPDQIDGVSQREITLFSRGGATAVGTLSLAFWLLQLSAGQSATPDFSEWPGTQRLLAEMLLRLCWGLGLFWVWFGKGASLLSRMQRIYRPRSSRFLTSPTAFKVECTIVVLINLFALSKMQK